MAADHYAKLDKHASQCVQCGHCDYPRVKTRMPYDICGHFQRREVK